MSRPFRSAPCVRSLFRFILLKTHVIKIWDFCEVKLRSFFLLCSVTAICCSGSWISAATRENCLTLTSKKKNTILMFYRHLALPLQPCVLSLVSLIPSDIEDRSLLSECLHSCSRTALWRGLQQILIVGRTVAFNSSWWPLSPAARLFLFPVCDIRVHMIRPNIWSHVCNTTTYFDILLNLIIVSLKMITLQSIWPFSYFISGNAHRVTGSKTSV